MLIQSIDNYFFLEGPYFHCSNNINFFDSSIYRPLTFNEYFLSANVVFSSYHTNYHTTTEIILFPVQIACRLILIGR